MSRRLTGNFLLLYGFDFLVPMIKPQLYMITRLGEDLSEEVEEIGIIFVSSVSIKFFEMKWQF